MLYSFILTIIYNFFIVECLLPTLSVQNVDQSIIERKRQDTLEMCQMFNEGEFYPGTTQGLRVKRNAATPSVNIKDKAKIEGLIDEFYADMADKGQPINYRRRKFVLATPRIRPPGGRRFDFAPKFINASTSAPESTTSSHSTNPGRDVIRDWKKHWKHGIVPYFIDPKTYDRQLAEIMVKAFDYFEKATCIRLQRLREKPSDKESLEKVEWLYITNPLGIRQCVHSNEIKPNIGVQYILFGYNCMSHGQILHEMMHVLGFSHEHTRPDRDAHVHILWDNIKPGYKKYFEIREEDAFTALPYDFNSVLHYPQRSFSRNGKPTIVAEPGVRLGQREGLSAFDVEKVKIIYGPECAARNRQYLMSTCPNVIKSSTENSINVTKQDVDAYFKDRLWQYGTINIKFRDRFQFTPEETRNIQAVIDHIQSETCIEFVENTADDDQENGNESDRNSKAPEKYTDNDVNSDDNEIEDNTLNDSKSGDQKRRRHRKSAFANTRRHAASVLTLVRSDKPGCPCPKPGKPSGDQVLKIHNDCFNSVNDLLHLFVHVIGLDHQHTSHDRDFYLHIVWTNLTSEIKNELEKKLPPAASLGFPYDYQSVMHYPWLQIKNGRTNIMYPIWNDGWSMGHWQGLSLTDVKKINLLYKKNCQDRKSLSKSSSESEKKALL